MEILIIISIILLVLGIPIGVLLGLISVALLYFTELPFSMILVIERFIGGINSFTLMAVPFFMLTGHIMEASGVTNKLLKFSDLLVGKLPGGIGHMNIAMSVFFAGLSGSGLADVAGLGPIQIPMMIEKGYSREYSTSITVASSMLGPVIPPSIALVIYGATLNVSIAGLFAAGVTTGLLIAFFLFIANTYISIKKGVSRRERKIPLEEALQIIKETGPAFGLPVLILVFVVGGITTPTEAGAVAVLYALFLGLFFYKTISLKDVVNIFGRTIIFSSVIFLLIGTSTVIGHWLTMARIPQLFTNWLLAFSENPLVIILFINLILLFVGMFMDVTAALLILGPILAPIAISFGFHPLHIGIIICLNLTLGMMTPPLGTCLFAGCAVGDVKYDKLVIAIFPLLIVNLTSLAIITLIPEISMFLPRLLGYY